MRIISCDVLVSKLSELQTKSSAVTIAILNQELKYSSKALGLLRFFLPLV